MSNIILGNNNTKFKVGGNDCSIYLGTTLLYSGGTQPVFEGKWMATDINGNVTSAACDSSSTITQGEITSSAVTIQIGDCVTTIDYDAFSGFESLSSVTIPNSVTSISPMAFYDCSSLTGITIPSGVTSINYSTFQNCHSLSSIIISSGVTTIGEHSFDTCDGITSLTIPNSVTSIGDEAFINCDSLTSVTIGSGVTTIGDYAFYDCERLESFTIYAITPPTIGESIISSWEDYKIYVPSVSLNAYKTAWSDYEDRIYPIPS